MYDAVIIGGGIAGLTAALALQKQGIEAHVFEQAHEITEVGAGIQLAPNGIRQLKRLGFDSDLDAALTPFSASSRYRFSDGSPAGNVLVHDGSGEITVSGIHRADLIELLRRAVRDSTVHVNHQLTEISSGDSSHTLQFANGQKVRSRLVVGADGIHSRVRDFVTTSSSPVFSGMNAYRGTVAYERVPDWPNDEFQVWMGERRHFLTFPVRKGQEINFVGFVPAHEGSTESWSAPGDPDDLRAHFAGWDSAVERLLATVKVTNWWGLYDREPLPTWHRNHVTLVGDAAHAMLPHSGQGANQAIEDAVVLAQLLAMNGNDIVSAFERYEEVRLPRTRAVQEGSRQNGLRYDSMYDDLEQRDREIAQISAYRSTIYDFDALAGLA